jgi:hypothetical protein
MVKFMKCDLTKAFKVFYVEFANIHILFVLKSKRMLYLDGIVSVNFTDAIPRWDSIR